MAAHRCSFSVLIIFHLANCDVTACAKSSCGSLRNLNLVMQRAAFNGALQHTCAASRPPVGQASGLLATVTTELQLQAPIGSAVSKLSATL